MSYNLSTLIACPKVQGQLNEITEKGANPNEPAPELMFLTSQANTSRILETNVLPGAGKIKTVQVVYSPRITESADQVSTTVSTNCDAGVNAGNLSTDYTIDESAGVTVKETIKIADLARICQNNQDYFAQRVLALLDVATRKMQTTVATQMSVLNGWFATDNGETGLSLGNSGPKIISTKYAAAIDGGKPNPSALQEIVFSAMNSGFTGVPYVFGFGEIWRYFNYFGGMGNTSDGGLDFVKYFGQNQVGYLPSMKMHQALNSGTSNNDFLVADLGSLFLLQYNRMDDPFLKTGDDALVIDTIVDPKSGVAFNYKVKKTCEEEVTVIISSAFKVVGLPNDIYASGDRLSNTNGVLKFRITNS